MSRQNFYLYGNLAVFLLLELLKTLFKMLAIFIVLQQSYCFIVLLTRPYITLKIFSMII